MEKIKIICTGKIDGKKIKNAPVEVEVLYRIGTIVVHHTIWDDGVFHKDTFTVSNASCGIAYERYFNSFAKAKEFADYCGSVRELWSLTDNKTKPPLPVIQAMNAELLRIKNAD